MKQPNKEIKIKLGNNHLIIRNNTIQSNLHVEKDTNWNNTIHGIESLVLAQHCAGIDVTTVQYINALETCLDACEQNII